MTSHRFSDQDIAAVYRAISERRDMRHFRPDRVAPEILSRLLNAAHCAPSVGLMQPWRFIRITDDGLRHAMYELVQEECRLTAEAIGEAEGQPRQEEFLRLKVEGIRQCGELLVAALCDRREQHIFGRRTLPEMDLASVACAIQNLWLAARAEGLGMGWVSLFDPEQLRVLLSMPEDAKPVAILCLGHVETFYAKPMLVEAEWTEARPLQEMVMENGWNSGPPSR